MFILVCMRLLHSLQELILLFHQTQETRDLSDKAVCQSLILRNIVQFKIYYFRVKWVLCLSNIHYVKIYFFYQRNIANIIGRRNTSPLRQFYMLLSMLYVYCMFASCLSYVLVLFIVCLHLLKVSIFIAPCPYFIFLSFHCPLTANFMYFLYVHVYNSPSLFDCLLSLPIILSPQRSQAMAQHI